MTLQEIIIKLIETALKPAVPLLIGLAVVVFFWGLVKYLNAGMGDAKNIKEARDLMIWGIIAITVMVSVWGIVKVVQTTFLGGTSFSSPTDIPQFGGNIGGGTEPLELRDFTFCPDSRCDPNLPPSNPCACSQI